jgi:hypothetical protein
LTQYCCSRNQLTSDSFPLPGHYNCEQLEAYPHDNAVPAFGAAFGCLAAILPPFTHAPSLDGRPRSQFVSFPMSKRSKSAGRPGKCIVTFVYIISLSPSFKHFTGRNALPPVNRDEKSLTRAKQTSLKDLSRSNADFPSTSCKYDFCTF